MAVALFHGKLSSAETTHMADTILRVTGLDTCKRTRAGNDDYPGLSGGQRRRLSLAVALAKKPAVLIADEPTTGLDSAAAVAITKLLGELARDSRVAVVCTIHQPSALMYERLDKLLLLTKGRTAYYGPASGLLTYLDSVGKPLPQGASLAEHALNLVNADFENEAAVDAMIEKWRSAQAPLAGHAAKASSLPTPQPRATLGRQVATLLPRMAQVAITDAAYLRGRMLFIISLCGICAIFSVSNRDREQIAVYYIFMQMILVALGIAFSVPIGFLATATWWPQLSREIKSDMYSPLSYWIVAVLIGAAASLMLSLSALPCAYILNDLNWATFSTVWMLLAGVTFFLEGALTLAGFLGLALGVLVVGPIIVMGIMSNGALVPGWQHIIWPLRGFSYVLPMRQYVSAAVSIVIRESHDFTGAVVATDATSEGRAALAKNESFYCLDTANDMLSCYGITGHQAIATLQVCACVCACVRVCVRACMCMLCVYVYVYVCTPVVVMCLEALVVDVLLVASDRSYPRIPPAPAEWERQCSDPNS